MFKNNLEQVFPILYHMYDVNEVILVGSDIASWIDVLEENSVEKVFYINQNDQKYTFDRLPENWFVTPKLLTKEDGEVEFYTLSNPMLNGTVSGEVLSHLWKNLKTLTTDKREGFSLKTLIHQHSKMTSSKMLVIDSFDALSILNDIGNLHIGVIAARVISDDDTDVELATQTVLDEQMSQYGYKNIAIFEDNHPKVKIVVYTIDHQQQIKRLQEKLEQEKQGEKSLEEELSKFTLGQETKIQDLSQKEEAIIQLKKENEDLQQQLLTTRKEHSLIISKITDHINKSSLNIIKQIESFFGLQQYISSPLNFHGWPISPDIALFMAQKIEENNYDLIIEFGSGTSTMLFANIAKSIKKKTGKTIKVVSFEHNEKYYNQTKQQLKQKALNKYASVKYAPLTKYIYQDLEFMYYDCESWLQKLKDKNKYHKVLVLVDGPPGVTGPLARFPALPHLLDQFTQQDIDLVLDDSNRAEEKAIVEKWEKLLEESKIIFKSESIPSEKGLYFCQINKKQNRID